VLGDVELRAALELLLRYAVRYIDQDPDTAEQPDELCEPNEPRESDGPHESYEPRETREPKDRPDPGEPDVVIVDAAVPGVIAGLDTALTD
jgi:hypothetical protein